jgi:PhnB protein
MSIRQLNPYLHFNGDADQAIRLYERALGARTEQLSRWSEAPGSMQVNPQDKNRVMHATLSIGEATVMLADAPSDHPAPRQSNVQLSLAFSDVAELEQRFAALAAGGQVELPPQDMFWGARFGMLTDAHGIRWMLSCELGQR